MQNNTNDYKSPKAVAQKTIIWVLSTNGEVLIKDVASSKTEMKIGDLTIVAKSLKDGIHAVERQTGVLGHEEMYRKLFSPKNIVPGNSCEMYVLPLNINKECKEIIKDTFEGVFIDYRDLMSHLSKLNLTTDCKEYVLTFISEVYETYTLI